MLYGKAESAKRALLDALDEACKAGEVFVCCHPVSGNLLSSCFL